MNKSISSFLPGNIGLCHISTLYFKNLTSLDKNVFCCKSKALHNIYTNSKARIKYCMCFLHLIFYILMRHGLTSGYMNSQNSC
jgi:hypothetical protein